MLNFKQTAQELDAMLYDVIMQAGIFVPVNKTTFQSKKYQVKKTEEGWSVYDLSTKIKLADTYLKVSAFAVCKLHEKRLSARVQEVLYEDTLFSKNYIDSLFHKNTVKTSKDTAIKDNATWRYELVHGRAKRAKDRIDSLFYSSIA
jgi:hypothetical protein